MSIEIMVTDGQEFDYDAEIANVDEVVALLARMLNDDGAVDRDDALNRAIYLLNCYADTLNDEKERNI